MKKWVTSLVDPINKKIEDYNNEMIRLLTKNKWFVMLDLSYVQKPYIPIFSRYGWVQVLITGDWIWATNILEHGRRIGAIRYVHVKNDKIKRSG